MDPNPRTFKDVNDLVAHLRDLTAELTAVHNELYWLALQAQDSNGKQSPAELKVDTLAELKGAVDNMRLLLWNYIETASEIDPQGVQEGMESQRMRRVTDFLELLRDRLVHVNEQQPLSFIEKINASVKAKLRDPRAA